MIPSDTIIRHVPPYQQGIYPLPHGLVRFGKLEINHERVTCQIDVEKTRVRGEPTIIFVFHLPFLWPYPVITPFGKWENINQMLGRDALGVVKQPDVFRFAYRVRVLVAGYVEIPIPQVPYLSCISIINLHVKGRVRQRRGIRPVDYRIVT